MTDQSKSTQLVDHLFRHEYGKMVAALSRFLGLTHLETVEDIVQETFIQAILTWRGGKIPDNPPAWLMTVAKRKAIDYIRKKKSRSSRESMVNLSGPGSAYIEELFMESEIPDNQLRMIFACCHPQLANKDKIAMTLKVVSGFSSKEIARALRTNAETIKKRLQRARKFLVSNNLKLHIPSGKSLMSRLSEVRLSLYLIFNEGYYASSGDKHIKKDLCLEAMRLCKLLVEHSQTRHPNNHALLALMCFHASRFESRMPDDGTIILLGNQDRTQWDRQLINIGHYHLHLASRKHGFISTYHWEAAISSEHAKAQRLDETNWTRILQYYNQLYSLRPSEQILLNQVVVLLQLNRIEAAETLFNSIEQNDNDAVLYHSVAAEIYKKQRKIAHAIQHLQLAADRAPTPSEYKIIQRKIADLE